MTEVSKKKPLELEEGDLIDLTPIFAALKAIDPTFTPDEGDVMYADSQYAVVDSVEDEGRGVVIYNDTTNISVPHDLPIDVHGKYDG